MEEALNDLRDACAVVAKRLDAASVVALTETLPKLPPSALQQLAEYILFPLRVVAKHPRAREPDAIAALQGMAALFRLSSPHDPTQVRTHVSFLALYLDNQVSHIRPLPEELREAAVLALRSLVTHAQAEALLPIYADNALSVLGHCLHAILECVGPDDTTPAPSSSSATQPPGSGDIDSSLSSTTSDPRGPLHSRSLQIAALETLTAFFQRAPEGAPLAPFLPGIASGLARVALKDRQGQGVIAAAHVCFGELIALVLNSKNMPASARETQDPLQALRNIADLCNRSGGDTDALDPALLRSAAAASASPGQRHHSQSASSSTPEDPRMLKVDQQDIGWWRETAAHLHDFMKEMCQTSVGHESWRVRHALLQAARRVLGACVQSLPRAVPLYLDVVVSLTDDDIPEVSALAQRVLDDLAASLLPGVDAREASGAVETLLEGNLQELVSSLPRVMRQSLDKAKLRAVRLAVAYVRLLGPRMRSALLSDQHLRRLGVALMQTLDFDDSDVMLIVEQSSSPAYMLESGSRSEKGEGEEATAAGFVAPPFKKQFRHFRDERILSAITRLCNYLGFYGNLSALASHFFGLYREGEASEKAALFVLNELLAGASGAIQTDRAQEQACEGGPTRAEVLSLARQLMDEYLALVDRRLVTSNTLSPLESELSGRVASSNALTNHTVAQLHHNTILTCLSIETIATVARVFGRDFSLTLMDTLYPLLSLLGNPTAVVSQSALYALGAIAAACGLKSPAHVISSNGDYLVNTIAQNIKYLSMHPDTGLVFTMMLKHSDYTLLPCAKDLADDVFDALDGYSDEHLGDFIAMLNSIVSAVWRWLPNLPAFAPRSDEPSSSDGKSYEEEPEEAADGIPRFPLGQEEEEEDEDGSGREPVSMPKDDPEPPTPPHQQLVIQVLERCVHLMGCTSPRARLLVLETVGKGVQVLRGNDGKLLPIAHKMWDPIVHRLQDPEPVVAAAAVRTLPVLSDACGSFLRDRMLRQAFPLMSDLLVRTEQERRQKGAARFTMAFKTQEAILSTLARLCKPLDMNGNDVPPISKACLPFLNASQPQQLRDLAVQVFTSLAEIDPDAVWFTLAQVSAPSLSPPHASFVPLVLPPPDSGYAASAAAILNTL